MLALEYGSYINKMLKIVLVAALLLCGAIAEEALQRNILPRPAFQNKVIGGSPININTWNSIVSLQRGFTSFGHSCGGNILTVNVLLSAAHCFQASWDADWSRPEFWRVRAGSNNHASGGSYHQLSRVVNHPSYNSNTYDNDIVVLRLLTPLSLSANVGQAVIPPQNGNVADGTAARTAGWGATAEGGNSSPVLLAATLQIVNQQTCHNAYNSFGGITARMICAGWPSGGFDACQGDSGGPLIANGVLVGVVSWGFGCARPGFPGVNARVSSFSNWISDTANSI